MKALLHRLKIMDGTTPRDAIEVQVETAKLLVFRRYWMDDSKTMYSATFVNCRPAPFPAGSTAAALVERKGAAFEKHISQTLRDFTLKNWLALKTEFGE